MQGARSGRFRHPASRDTCTSMCGAGTAVYIRVHEDSEYRATQQSGRTAGFKRFPTVLRPAVLPDCIAVKSHALCGRRARSEEHTSELQSLMRISYAVFCLKKKKQQQT